METFLQYAPPAQVRARQSRPEGCDLEHWPVQPNDNVFKKGWNDEVRKAFADKNPDLPCTATLKFEKARCNKPGGRRADSSVWTASAYCNRLSNKNCDPSNTLACYKFNFVLRNFGLADENIFIDVTSDPNTSLLSCE